jgi:hypothetical protein
MSIFTIDAENNITAHAELPASADASQSLSSAKELSKLTAGMSSVAAGGHLVQISRAWRPSINRSR